jgi:hypothetical protein
VLNNAVPQNGREEEHEQQRTQRARSYDARSVCLRATLFSLGLNSAVSMPSIHVAMLNFTTILAAILVSWAFWHQRVRAWNRTWNLEPESPNDGSFA